MKTIGYLPVSTDQQAERGVGLDAQRTAIGATAERMGLQLAAVFEDAGLSGSLGVEDRPGLLNAIAALKRSDVLIVAKRDRLGRDVIAVAMIERLIARRGRASCRRPARAATVTERRAAGRTLQVIADELNASGYGTRGLVVGPPVRCVGAEGSLICM